MVGRLHVNIKTTTLFVMITMAFALLVPAVCSPQATHAAAPTSEGIVISLDNAPIQDDDMVKYEVTSYRLVQSNEVVTLDDSLYVMVPDTMV